MRRLTPLICVSLVALLCGCPPTYPYRPIASVDGSLDPSEKLTAGIIEQLKVAGFTPDGTSSDKSLFTADPDFRCRVRIGHDAASVQFWEKNPNPRYPHFSSTASQRLAVHNLARRIGSYLRSNLAPGYWVKVTVHLYERDTE